MRPVGCRSDDLLGGPIRVSRSRLKFKVSRLARTPGIRETGPGGDREELRGAGAMGPGTPGSRPTSRTTDLQADAVAGCKQDPPTRPAGTKAERRVPGARPERWERGRRARSVCGSHDPSHHPKEGRPHAPRERYDAGSGQVCYLLLIGCLICLTCFGGLNSPPSMRWLRRGRWLTGRDRGMRLGGRLRGLRGPGRLDLTRLGDPTGGPRFRGDRLPQIVQFHGPRLLQLLAVIVGDI